MTKLERRKKKGNFWLEKKTKNSNERLKGNKKKRKEIKKRGEIKRIAPQRIKQQLCKNKQYKEKEQKIFRKIIKRSYCK